MMYVIKRGNEIIAQVDVAEDALAYHFMRTTASYLECEPRDLTVEPVDRPHVAEASTDVQVTVEIYGPVERALLGLESTNREILELRQRLRQGYDKVAEEVLTAMGKTLDEGRSIDVLCGQTSIHLSRQEGRVHVELMELPIVA